ncbi:glutamate racemase [Nibricoccus aquaticus]|uniref:Glutamate racemase n=1 Tax=Nibricoccus aquaticus TaxID=2576891 RepID=A0A290Q6P0_9BACT|nr:glutamate racemase [Nibricoccus aquaticus]ATC64335.1 glutamate racemase [Nibricoccus aquaticus]
MIGVFDSGFGGLTVLNSLFEALPAYDYLFLADSARAPYGARSPDVINDFTLESVEWLFEQGCTTVILACNTSSARALRNIQQLHLPRHRPHHRVLGVVRPSVEALIGLPPGTIPGETPPSSASGTVAVLATESTVTSDSYGIELRKLAPSLTLIQQACPLWVPLVEAGELSGPGAEFFLQRALTPVLERPEPPQRILLGCTHFPLLLPALRRLIPPGIEILDQGALVATRFADWLARHPEHESKLTRHGSRRFATTDDPAWFAARGERMLGHAFTAERARLRPILPTPSEDHRPPNALRR